MPKRPAKGRNTNSKPRRFKKSDGTIKKWNTIDDIPMDEEDQFHASKDRILLEGDDVGGWDSENEEEVFALKGLEREFETEQEDDQEEQEPDEEVLQEQPPTSRKRKKSKKTTEKQKPTSDEDEEEEETWGRGKAAYYASNADQFDSDDEEANELEEQEAIRLQRKIHQELQDEDFGLNDTLEREGRPGDDDILDPTPVVLPTLPTDKQSLLRHFEKTNPVSLALARDWDDTAHKLQKSRLKIEKLEAEKSDSLGPGMFHLHYQALLSYSTVLAFYLHIRASAKYAQRPALLQTHPIMQRLLTLKQSLQALEDLDFALSNDDEDEDEDGEFMGTSLDDILADGEKLWKFNAALGLEPNELDDLLNDAELPVKLPESEEHRPKKKRKVIADNKKKSTSKLKAPVFDLTEPEFVSSKSSTRLNALEDPLDVYGDATTLTTFDAVDKNVRKKSLRFHTAKIESASSRRKGARMQSMGGDDDIPYRERKKNKDAKLVKEAVKRAEQERGADLNDEEVKSTAGKKRARGDDEGDESLESPDDYYELVQKQSKSEKMKKKVEYEEAHGLSRVPLEESSGPRSLTRAILKNKGLTPRRPKAVRNPRVKKRQRFEKAKKKVASQKAVYKGGLAETKGRYDGERTGISKVVKSISLS